VLAALCCATLVSLVLASLASAQDDHAAAPASTVILLVTITHAADGVHYRAAGDGTAFVVDPQGLALNE
jgi:hypothetical protein